MFTIMCLLKIKMKFIISNLKFVKKSVSDACNNIRPPAGLRVSLVETGPVLTQWRRKKATGGEGGNR